MTFGELKAKAVEAKISKGRDLIHVHVVRLKSLLSLMEQKDLL
jgi:hypothetical protein